MHPSTKRGFSNFHFDRRPVPVLHFVEHLERTIVRPEFSRLATAEANGSERSKDFERVKGLERLSDPVVPACTWRLHDWRTQQKCWVVSTVFGCSYQLMLAFHATISRGLICYIFFIKLTSLLLFFLKCYPNLIPLK